MYIDDRQTPLKFKQLCDLTIDLTVSDGQFYARDCTDAHDDIKHIPIQISLSKNENISMIHNNTIYRFLPHIEDGVIRLTTMSERPDKIICNRTDTVDHIIQRIDLNWSVDNVLNTHESINHIYYEHNVQSTNHMNPDIGNLLSIQTNMAKNTLNLLDIKSKVMLDIGCGNGTLGRYAICSKKLKKYYGIDVDPVVLGSNIGNLPNQCLIWGDPNKSNMEYFTNYEDKRTFVDVDIITIINSIHYFNLDMIMRICNLSDKNLRYIVVYGMFSENISSILDKSDTSTAGLTAEFGDSFRITKKIDQMKENGKDIYEFMYPWKSDSFNESIYQLKHVIESFKKYGWDIETCDTIKLDDVIKSGLCSATAIRYESFITMHNRVVFKKLT